MQLYLSSTKESGNVSRAFHSLSASGVFSSLLITYAYSLGTFQVCKNLTSHES